MQEFTCQSNPANAGRKFLKCAHPQEGEACLRFQCAPPSRLCCVKPAHQQLRAGFVRLLDCLLALQRP